MRKRILIIDDEPDILKTTKYLLENEGYNVCAVEDGEDGLRILSKLKLDLVLLDLKLPGKTGFQIVNEIKANDVCKDIPIIVLSGMQDEASKYVVAKGGVLEFIEKPIDPVKLKFHIQDILENRTEAEECVKKRYL